MWHKCIPYSRDFYGVIRYLSPEDKPAMESCATSACLRVYYPLLLAFVVGAGIVGVVVAGAVIFCDQAGDVDREDGEHHHAQSCHEHREDAAHGGDGHDIGAHGGAVHQSPPQGVGVVGHESVGTVLEHIEY